MANFLITTPNSLTQGTDTSDLFVLNTALGTTVNGGGGADQFSATVSFGSNAILAAGAGNDSIYLTAGGADKVLSITQILAGNGNDLIAINTGIGILATILGGGGNDTINLLAGSYTDGQINGNQGADLLSAASTVFTRGLIGGGGDNDTIKLDVGTIDRTTINGGGGNDQITLSGQTVRSAIRIEGDTIGDSTFFGNDTISIQAGGLTASFVQGGGGADVILVSATLGTNVSIEGNQGADSILVHTLLANGATFIGAGAGNDSITITRTLVDAFGTIQGGGGVDVISVTGGAANGGFIFGGADADSIGVGTLAGRFNSAATAPVIMSGDLAQGINLGYSTFSQSTINGFDVVSAANASADSISTIMINQSVVNFAAVATGIRIGDGTNSFTVDTNQRVVAFGGGTDNLTARATTLDAGLSAGQAVVFRAAGQNYMFVQGGAARGGLADDLLVDLNVGGFSNAGQTTVTGQLVGGLAINGNNSIKLGFTQTAGL